MPEPLSTVERHRLADEWANGVELYDVPAISCLIQGARRVPALRTALNCGSRTLTYGELFDRVDALHAESAGFAFGSRTSAAGSAWAGATVSGDGREPGDAALDGLVRLLSEIVSAATADALPVPPSDCTGGHPGECGLAQAGDCAFTRARGLAEPVVSGLALTLSALAAAADDRRGVVADHRICRVDRAYGSADVRLLAVAWDGADAAVELLAALADGATLVLATAAQRADAAALAGLIAETSATHVLAEADALAGFADLAAPFLPSVRRWDVTGTSCPAILSGLLRMIAPDSVAGFAYTAPEYAGVVARGPLDGSGRVRPIPGARLLVLDAELCLLAPGESGDVHIGGAALAIEPADAAATFIADPYAPGRVARTGERGRWTADGWLVFDAAATGSSESAGAAGASGIDFAAA
ncbi:AMP-binding protein [Nocardia sp. 2]|uniref:AMP-binding protein n=1 Tax=Nocardia acididurans TaxID=2802282 RepID=A0ABS1M3Y1_9NOCA|nr:AMP-binding protein [Nocardia acididurans]MBL1075254.1 AMP-binding protein [Nocardia acididurans]